MFGDDREELHQFAKKLGLKRAWFQDHRSNPVFWHYDLTKNKRQLAVRHGAKEVTFEEWNTRVQKTLRKREEV